MLSYGRESRLEVEGRGNNATEDRLHHLMVGDTLWLVPVEGVRAVDHRLWERLLKIAEDGGTSTHGAQSRILTLKHYRFSPGCCTLRALNVYI